MGRRAFVLLPAVLALALVAWCPGATALSASAEDRSPASGDPFPPVPSLRPQIDFWLYVFTRLRQDKVVLHDARFPQLRYEVFTLPGRIDGGLDREQRRHLDRRRDGLTARLEVLADKVRQGNTLSEGEQALLDQLEAAGGRDALAGAAQRVRAQRGLREQFLAGVRRSGRHIAEMRGIFSERDMPEDLAWLPHVESSFDIEARSTAGAAGIWQFTRETGRRYLHISNALDERLDPIEATRAAADHLQSAFALLGDWALAITSYNHGTSGVLRASRQHGADLERIVRDYRSASFGFASSNFYTEFLAVREILNHPEQHFTTPLQHDHAVQRQSLQLPRPVSAARLAQLLDTNVANLATANPAWLEKTLLGKVSLPAGTRVWLPGDVQPGNMLTEQLQVAEYDAPPPPVNGEETYRVRSGDTLEKIARRAGVSVSALRHANNIRPGSHLIRTGQQLVVPDTLVAGRHTTAAAQGEPTLHRVRNGENPFLIARRYRIPLNTLLVVNGLDSNAIIHPGQHLRIPVTATP